MACLINSLPDNALCISQHHWRFTNLINVIGLEKTFFYQIRLVLVLIILKTDP